MSSHAPSSRAVGVGGALGHQHVSLFDHHVQRIAVAQVEPFGERGGEGAGFGLGQVRQVQHCRDLVGGDDIGDHLAGARL